MGLGTDSADDKNKTKHYSFPSRELSPNHTLQSPGASGNITIRDQYGVAQATVISQENIFPGCLDALGGQGDQEWGSEVCLSISEEFPRTSSLSQPSVSSQPEEDPRSPILFEVS